MAKKKSKHKRKPKLTCPFGHIFGQDGIDKKECDKCSLVKPCGDKSFLYEKKRREKREEEREKKREERRKKKPQKPKKKTTKPKKELEQDNRGLYIPSPALNKLLALSYHSCMRVYSFYMKEGRRQKTDKPWCNNRFVANGLGCSISTVVTAKNLLIKAGFITITGRRGEQGHFGKHYIKLKYYPSKFVIEKEEYLRQLDKYAEDLADFCNTFTSEKMKMEIKLIKIKTKYKELKRKYRKLKEKCNK